MIVPRLPLQLVILLLCFFTTIAATEEASNAKQDSSWLSSLWQAFFNANEIEKVEEVDNKIEDVIVTSPEPEPEPSTTIEELIDNDNSSKNDSTSEDLLSIEGDHNLTNTTTVPQRIRHTCIPHVGCSPQLNCTNVSLLNDTMLQGIANQSQVVGVNLTQLEYLLENISSTNACIVVMFYTTWCQYSVDFAPVYNKLGVVFPQIPVIAMDFGLYSPDRYLLAYIPRVILYYSGYVVYDIDTTMSIEELTTILANMTSLTPSSIPTDEEMSDYASPLPETVIEDNSVLWLAIVALVTIFGGSCVQKSDAFAKCKERIFNRVKED